MNCQVTLSTVLDVVPMVISYANDTVWIELTVVFSDISIIIIKQEYNYAAGVGLSFSFVIECFSRSGVDNNRRVFSLASCRVVLEIVSMVVSDRSFIHDFHWEKCLIEFPRVSDDHVI